MGLSFTGKKRIRKSFGVIPETVPMPNLIEVQKSSYDQFLMKDVPAAERGDEGLQAVFKSVFPIKDFPRSRFSTSYPMSSSRRNLMSMNASSAI
nr:hypothetical protein [Hyphobacterium sp. CCMP332]